VIHAFVSSTIVNGPLSGLLRPDFSALTAHINLVSCLPIESDDPMGTLAWLWKVRHIGYAASAAV
jgi:hypothetical protein